MGRYIVFTLILANLVLFLWNYTHPVVVPEQKPPEIPADVPSLTLLHERALENEQQPAGIEQTAPAPEIREKVQIETEPTLTEVVPTEASPKPTVIEKPGLETESRPTVVAVNPVEKEISDEPLETAEEEEAIQADDQQSAAIDEEGAKVTEEKVEIPVQIYCYTLGPFPDAQMAKVKSAEIEAIGFPVAQRATEEREIKHYWIYLPPFPDDKAAQRASKKLARNGIKDYFIVTTEENKNAISLGLFKRQSGAQKRSKRIRRIGFAPKIEVRYRSRTYYWLDYEETEDHQLPSQIWQSIETGKGPVQRITRDCT